MAELSHRPLRELIAGFGGCDEYFTEMISAGALLGGGPFESYYADGGPCPERVVYQLTGSDPERIADAAALLDRNICAGIDINMGCSAPAIVRTGAGAAWMASPDRAGALIARVRRRTKKRLSVKLRIGPEDDFDYLAAFCRRLEDGGLDFITLHPRTTREKFKRRSRWEYVARLRAVLGIPVAGNGDIASADELVRRAAGETSPPSNGPASSRPWDAVMIGRLAVRCPWVFAQARAMEGAAAPAPAAVNLEETALRFLDLLSRYQPPEFHLSRARRFFSYFCDNLKWANHVKTLLNRETSLPAIAACLSSYFRDHPEEIRLTLS
jgi:tRNA-dihydrouridine synthase